jgi:hypothetical protein
MWNCAFLSEVGRVEINRRGRAQWVSSIYRIVIGYDSLEATFLRGDLRLDQQQIDFSLQRMRRLITRSVRYKIYAAAKTL